MPLPQCHRVRTPVCVIYNRPRFSGTLAMDTDTSKDAICWPKMRLPQGCPTVFGSVLKPEPPLPEYWILAYVEPDVLFLLRSYLQ